MLQTPNTPTTPITPITPVTTAAIKLLHDIISQEACALNNERSKQRLKRQVQKLASAAQISLTKQTLLEEHNRLLIKVNNKVKVRRLTRSVVLKKAKVMSYEDLQKARAKRAKTERDRATKSKGKRGRKRKSPALELELETEEKTEFDKATAADSKGKRGRKRKCPAIEAEAGDEAGPSVPKVDVALPVIGEVE